jgi:predicted oxidoreductase
MKYINLGGSGLMASAVGLGCMRIAKLERDQVVDLVGRARDSGLNLFDHADIYAKGQSEEIFAQALGMRASLRDNIIIQSKCGICEGYYDSSKQHILSSVDGSLKRLRTDHLDVLLLHRPDALSEPQEIADAFDALAASGKVRYFGVSNHNSAQLDLLRKEVRQPLIINQLQLSVAHTAMIDSGLNVNMTNTASTDRDGSVLEYCRLKGVTLQAWSPLQYGMFAGSILERDRFPELIQVLNRVANDNGATAAAIAIAWILRHPAQMQAIVGSTSPKRIEEMARATDVELSRPQWYEIYRAAGNVLP